MNNGHQNDGNKTSLISNMGPTIPRKPAASAASLPPIPRRPSDHQIPRKPVANAGAPIPRRPPFEGQNIPRRSDGAVEGSIPRRPSPESMSIPRRSVSEHQIPRRTTPADRKPSSSATPPSSNRILPHARERPSLVTLKSEYPFVLTVKTRGVPYKDGIPNARTSRVAPKRKRPKYRELDDTDSEDLMDTDEEEETDKKRRMKKIKKVKTPVVSEDAFTAASSGIPTVVAGENVVVEAVIGEQVESPPPGVLPNLWYSREQVLHVWVMEKIIAWKKRPLVALEWSDPNAIKCIDQVEAQAVSAKALANESLWKDQNKRMEVSRINPTQCPMVMHLAAKKEAAKAKAEERPPKYTVVPQTADSPSEEVLLVKWRGRSFMHCSWERKKDIEKFDQSNNTARGKIKRYYQSQEVAYGPNWKQVLLSERTSPTDDGQQTREDEIFPPQYLEVERLMACDESEMNVGVLAKQRALNIREDHELLKVREKEEHDGIVHKHKGIFDDLPLISDVDGEEPWDPEDFVRYVVKWKAQQYSEMTWEYWTNIKRDAVNQAEDFWFRQQAPDPEDILKLPPHPHMRDFRKLVESPEFAVSKMPRPIADLGDGFKVEEDDEKDERVFKLRNYQLEGVNWLLFNWWNRRSCILADEMGLGKTIQSTGFLHQLHALQQTQIRGPFLIVAPLSLIGQWQSESQTWAPDLNVVFYHGSADAREFLVQQEFYYTDQFIPKQTAAKLKKMHVTKFHILITTYEVVLKDIEVLKKIRWKALIVDEAHRLKNPKARLFEELASVPRDFCLLLTGTPLQNSTEELWALLHFSDPVTFHSRDDFVEKFGELSDAKQVSDLHAVLKPYLLRRVKEDVEKSLPPKEETILEVTLTPIQKAYYKAIYERNTAFLFKGSKPSNAPSLMNVMMELRKACNHPFLIRGAEERIVADAVAAARDKRDENGLIPFIETTQMYGEQLIKASGKFVLLAKLLPKLYDGGHKVLIFSQMVRVLDLLEELIKWKKYRYERLDGSTNATARSAAVDRFIRKACKRFVMLLSTRAGGLGLNLTAADTVIIFDSDWNPQNDLQAMARSHRIGQTRPVRVYRLLTAKTYEMHMFHSASMKLGLDRAVLAHQRQQEGDDADGNTKKSDKLVQAKEIDELLKKGAYDVFRDDDDKEAQKFMETDIDQLLEQSAKKVTYGNATSNLSSGLGSFSKASFVADTGDGEKDVDLDDPDFWAKAVGLEAPVEVSEDIAQMIDDGVKRKRTQVQVYDPFAEMAETEQKKRDKIAQKMKEEKEEKEIARLERKLQKMEEKEKKRQSVKENDVETLPLNVPKPKEEKLSREPKVKKMKKSERSKAQRRAENEDPTLERLKQAWDATQRNRASSSLIRFGFDRYCRLRNDANLTSLPLQDVEIFVRAYLFQIALQIAVAIMTRLKEKYVTAKSFTDVAEGELRGVISYWLGTESRSEVDWICESVCSAAAMHLEVEANKRFLRLPLSLAEDEYVNEIKKGPALRALRRVGILDRLNLTMTEVVDELIKALGVEEMGRRGCLIKDYSMMDIDLKIRHVTSEELILGLAARLSADSILRRMPSAWWDRRCDLALLVGTFVHGFGNYEAMRNDDELPFSSRIEKCSSEDIGCANAARYFIVSTMVARKVFDEALECSKAKAQLEAHAAVAAVVAARKKAHEEGGGADEHVKDASAGVSQAVEALDVEADDLHMVTLPRLNREIGGALRKYLREENVDDFEFKLKSGESLPMPDPRVLDGRLVELIELIENRSIPNNSVPRPKSQLIADVPESVSCTSTILEKSCRRFGTKPERMGREFHGLGLSQNQCCSAYRTLDDGSDYAVGSASTDLNFVATGNDGPRYLRAMGVPINITRYGIVSAVNADMKVVEKMLANEQARNFRKKEEKKKEEVKIEEKKAEKKIEPADVKKEDVKKEDVKKEDPTPAKDEPDIFETIPPVIPQELILSAIRDNAELRAAICAVVLHFGCPIGKSMGLEMDMDVVQALGPYLPLTAQPPSSMFSLATFSGRVQFISGVIEMPSESEIRTYVESILLPHCLRISVYGNGPTTRQTRVSKGTFETAHGVSLYQEPFMPACTPLPDPCMSASEHSMEAVLSAVAMLRRIRLLRAAQFSVSGALSMERLSSICKSTILSQSMDGLPIWWNPSIHDVGLLVSVASGGIFSILERRRGTVFDPAGSAILEQVKALADGTEDEEWIKKQCADFPSPNLLERRLALLCSETTKHLDDETCYDHLPMFDHGGWPRN